MPAGIKEVAHSSIPLGKKVKNDGATHQLLNYKTFFLFWLSRINFFSFFIPAAFSLLGIKLYSIQLQ
jgi:hypothetical protein